MGSTKGANNGRARIPLLGRALSGTRFEARFRAEGARLLSEMPRDELSIDALDLHGRVEATSYPGGAWRHSVRVGDELLMVDAPEPFSPGSGVRVRILAPDLFLFASGDRDERPRTDSLNTGGAARVREASDA